jgi:hypothetical protein
MLTRFKKSVSRLTALALATWLAAPVYAAGCKMALAAPAGECHATVGETTLSGQASMSDASEHACCHWRGAEQEQQSPAGLLQIPTQSPNMMPCCTAGVRAATAALRPNVIPASTAAPAAEGTPHLPAATVLLAQSTRRASLTDGGRTHLRCCVFLI